MTWNHRVMKDAKSGDFIITECYYDEDGNVNGWTDTNGKGHAPWGEDLDEIRWVIEHMLKACDLPVLDEAELLREMEKDKSLCPECRVEEHITCSLESTECPCCLNTLVALREEGSI